MELAHEMYRNKLVRLLNELPDFQLREVYNFTLFLKEHSGRQNRAECDVPSVQASQVKSLFGLVAAGGDAVQDAEELYDE